MANRTLLLSGITAAGLLPLVLAARPAQANSSTVVFSVNCTSNQATPTASNFCAGLNATQSNPTFGIATPTSANRNANQKFAVDLESPTSTIPSNATLPYGTRYIWNTGTATPPATGSTSQTVQDTFNILNGVNYTVAPTGGTNGSNNILRINYADKPGSTVTQSGTNFERPLQISFNQFSLGGTCSICGPSNSIVATSAIYGIGRWVGDGNYNNGTGTYSFVSDPGRVNIGSRQGLITYQASVTIRNGIVLATSGNVKIEVFAPSPLPILGGGIAFSWSRRLRRRLQQATA